MGGGRKNKASSSNRHHNKSHQHQGSSKKQHVNQRSKASVDDQLRICLEAEVISNKFRYSLTWKEYLLLLLVIIVSLATCLSVGFLAGNTLSIHYYKAQENFEPSRRITTMDSDIQDVLKRQVKELPPLQDGHHGDSHSNQGGLLDLHVEATIHPTLCSDGETLGFSDWNTLKEAIHEANRQSAENFMRWNTYFAKNDASPKHKNATRRKDASLYYEQDSFFVICPDTTLTARRGPIYINAENIVLECDGCLINVGGSHFSFGPHTKNFLARGITFRGAKTSSLVFYHDGCDAAFEDCVWYGNTGNSKTGAVADVNSTSSVTFYRCDIDDTNNRLARLSGGGGTANQGLTSSLSIRS